jgi:hypothetical protein
VYPVFKQKKKARNYWQNRQAELFAQVMDVSRMNLSRTTCEDGLTKRWNFGYSFRTDGTAISLSFDRSFKELNFPVVKTAKAQAKDKTRGKSQPPLKRQKKAIDTETSEAKAALQLERKELKAQKELFFDPDYDSDGEEDTLRPVYMEGYPCGVFPDERTIRSHDVSALRLCGIDPGRNTLIEAVVQSADRKEPFRHHLSKRQYYHEGGLLRATKKREQWIMQNPEVREAQNRCTQPSLKQANLQEFHRCATLRRQEVDAVLWDFFAVPAFCNLKFGTFRMKQKTIGRFFRRLLAPESAQKEYEVQRKLHGKAYRDQVLKKKEEKKELRENKQGYHRNTRKKQKKTKAKKSAQKQKRANARLQVLAKTVVGYGNGNFPVAACNAWHPLRMTTGGRSVLAPFANQGLVQTLENSEGVMMTGCSAYFSICV